MLNKSETTAAAGTSTNPAVDEVVEIFDEHRANQITIADVNVGLRSFEFAVEFAVFLEFLHLLVDEVLRDKENNRWLVPFAYFFHLCWRNPTVFHRPHKLPKNGIGLGPGIPCRVKKSKFFVPYLKKTQGNVPLRSTRQRCPLNSFSPDKNDLRLSSSKFLKRWVTLLKSVNFSNSLLQRDLSDDKIRWQNFLKVINMWSWRPISKLT